jgi:hypothetical protein
LSRPSSTSFPCSGPPVARLQDFASLGICRYLNPGPLDPWPGALNHWAKLLLKSMLEKIVIISQEHSKVLSMQNW